VRTAKNPVLRVIEPGDQPVRCPPGRGLELAPQQALHYNSHVGAILEDFEQSEYKAVLREIERHVREWERQQRPEQAEWVTRQRMRGYRPTLSLRRRDSRGAQSSGARDRCEPSATQACA
jgi:hypothetical protein